MKMNNLSRWPRGPKLLAAVLLVTLAPLSRGAVVTVKIIGDSFSPATVTIKVGDTVTWSGLGNSHNVTGSTAADLDDFCGASLDSFGTETSCSHTFMTAGTFPYECTIHADCCGMLGTIKVVAPAAPTPAVTMTSPGQGAVFSAPANVEMAASATVSSGVVTNVTFFNGKTVLGAATAPPFGITASNLTAGGCALTAVATAAGISGTSAVVNITIISPGAVSSSAPQIINSLFTFGYSADAGLRYVVQESPDLVNWAPLITNVATVNSVSATDVFVPGGQRFYRVVRQPNP
jgi:plastocyanin